MVANTVMTGADERLMMIFLRSLVRYDDNGVAVLRSEVATELAAVIAKSLPETSAQEVYEAMDQAVLERGLDAPSAFLPLFFP